MAFILGQIVAACTTFEFWGKGDGYLIGVSAGQVICGTYTIMLCMLEKGEVLYWVYQLWPLFLVIFIGEIGLMFIVILCGFYGFAEADQMG